MKIIQLLDSGELTCSPVTHEPQRTIKVKNDAGHIELINIIGMRAHEWGYREGSLLLVHPSDEPELGEGLYCRRLVLIGYAPINN